MFIFATTEVQKIPITILSRCQRFDLRRLAKALIVERLQHICESEQVTFDLASLDLLAQAASGSLRDAQSLLDMAIGLCGEQLNAERIRPMLGWVEGTWIQQLTQHCFRGELPAALAQAQEIYQQGHDLRQVTLQWVEYLHDLILVKSAGAEALGEGVSQEQVELMLANSSELELERLQVAAQLVYQAAEQLFRSETPKILFDLLLVKLVHGSPFQSINQLMMEAETKAPEPALPSSAAQAPSPSSLSPQAASDVEDFSPFPPASASSNELDQALSRLLKNRPQIRALLDQALARVWEDNCYVLTFPSDSMGGEMLQERKNELDQALSRELGRSVFFKIKTPSPSELPALSEAERLTKQPSSDPMVKQAVEIFNATIKEVKNYGHE